MRAKWDDPVLPRHDNCLMTNGSCKYVMSVNNGYTPQPIYIARNPRPVFGLSFDDVRRLSCELAEANNTDHPFNTSTQKAGWDSLAGLRARHLSVALRTLEATSLICWKDSDKHPHPPSQIYDETSVTTVQTKPNKVIGLKRK